MEQKFDLKNVSSLKIFQQTPQATKIFYHEQFSYKNIQQ